MIEKLKSEKWNKYQKPEILMGEIVGDIANKTNEIIDCLNRLEIIIQQLQYTGKE